MWVGVCSCTCLLVLVRVRLCVFVCASSFKEIDRGIDSDASTYFGLACLSAYTCILVFCCATVSQRCVSICEVSVSMCKYDTSNHVHIYKPFTSNFWSQQGSSSLVVRAPCICNTIGYTYVRFIYAHPVKCTRGKCQRHMLQL